MSAEPTGFPSFDDYLSKTINHHPAVVWPAALRRHVAFIEARDRANLKLPRGAILPDGLTHWWVWNWADSFLSGTSIVTDYSVDDVKALLRFGREFDRSISLSQRPPSRLCPVNIEFTYYTTRIEAFSTRALDDEAKTSHKRIVARFFPRFSRIKQGRILCEHFVQWGSFLATSKPLTRAETNHIRHVGCSIRRFQDKHEMTESYEVRYGRLGMRILEKIQTAIRRISEKLDIGAVTIPQDMSFAEALDRTSQWLARVPKREEQAGSGETDPNQEVQSLKKKKAISIPSKWKPVLKDLKKHHSEMARSGKRVTLTGDGTFHKYLIRKQKPSAVELLNDFREWYNGSYKPSLRKATSN